MEETAKLICERLNATLAADPSAVTSVIETRYFCDEKIESDSPAVPMLDGDSLTLGALGLLNAIVTPQFRIVAHYDEVGTIVRFSYREEKKTPA